MTRRYSLADHAAQIIDFIAYLRVAASRRGLQDRRE
jgi:hypothetical protein